MKDFSFGNKALESKQNVKVKSDQSDAYSDSEYKSSQKDESNHTQKAIPQNSENPTTATVQRQAPEELTRKEKFMIGSPKV